MFRKVIIQDASGILLETFENYNDLYCLHELITNNRLNREGRVQSTQQDNKASKYVDLGGASICNYCMQS